MKKRFLTFGQKYAYETHPKYPKANPRGFLVFEYHTDEWVWKKIQEVVGEYYATSYSEEDWIDAPYPGADPYYPLGEIERFVE